MVYSRVVVQWRRPHLFWILSLSLAVFGAAPAFAVSICDLLMQTCHDPITCHDESFQSDGQVRAFLDQTIAVDGLEPLSLKAIVSAPDYWKIHPEHIPALIRAVSDVVASELRRLGIPFHFMPEHPSNRWREFDLAIELDIDTQFTDSMSALERLGLMLRQKLGAYRLVFSPARWLGLKDPYAVANSNPEFYLPITWVYLTQAKSLEALDLLAKATDLADDIVISQSYLYHSEIRSKLGNVSILFDYFWEDRQMRRGLREFMIPKNAIVKNAAYTEKELAARIANAVYNDGLQSVGVSDDLSHYLSYTGIPNEVRTRRQGGKWLTTIQIMAFQDFAWKEWRSDYQDFNPQWYSEKVPAILKQARILHDLGYSLEFALSIDDRQGPIGIDHSSLCVTLPLEDIFKKRSVFAEYTSEKWLHLIETRRHQPETPEVPNTNQSFVQMKMLIQYYQDLQIQRTGEEFLRSLLSEQFARGLELQQLILMYDTVLAILAGLESSASVQKSAVDWREVEKWTAIENELSIQLKAIKKR